MRKLLYGLIGLVLLLVGAALVVPGMIDWNSWKGEIAAQAKAATGRELVISGDLALAVLPAPRLTVHDVRLRNIAGASAPDMAVLRSLDVRIRFAPLLSGKVEVESVTLVEPLIRLEKLADGRVNWDFAPAGAAQAKPNAAGPSAAGGGEAVRLDSLRIVNGTLVWRDAGAGVEERVEKLNTTISARSLSGPFSLSGKLVARGMPLTLSASVGRIADKAPLPVTLQAGIEGTGAKLALSGAVSGIGASPGFNGKLEAEGGSLAKLIAAVAPGGAGLPGYLGQPFTLRAKLQGGEAGGKADDVELTLGATRANGTLGFDAGGRPRATVAMRAGNVDLDKWLAMPEAAAAPPPGGPSAGGQAGSGPAGTAAPAPAPAAFTLPTAMNASVSLAVEAATWQGQAVRDIRIEASLTEGELTLSQAALRLPGEAEALLTGFLNAKGGKPAFDGKIEARADNLRGTLDWLKLPVGQVPADRLRKFAVSAGLRGNDEVLQVIGAKISLDTSRIDGGVTVALRARPAFGASINVNQLNLDAYLPEAKPGASSSATAPVATGEPTPLKPGAAQPPVPGAAAKGPLAALNGFDANLQLRVGSLTLRQTPVDELRFDGTLAQGKLTVRDASVRSVAGTSASMKGDLSGFDGLPVFRGSFAADSRNLTGLLRLAGLEKSMSARRLGTMRLRGKADGGTEQVKFDATLDIAGGRIGFNGAMENLPVKPALNGALTANYRELSDLTAALGGEGGRRLGPMSAGITVKGGLEALTAQGTVRAVGGELGFGARALDLLTVPKYDANVTAANAELRDLLRVIAPDYRPAAAKLGPFRLEASLKGDPAQIELTKIKASAGPAAVAGNGTLALGGKRPALTATLTGGILDLNPFLPAGNGPAQGAGAGGASPAAAPGVPGSGATAAGGSSTPQGGGRYSTAPLDLSAMDAMDAKIALGATALIWRKFRVDNPAVQATLADRLLTVEQIAGKMFQGSFLMKGRLDGRRTPALDATVTVQQANVGQALFQAAAFDVAGGIMDFQTALTAGGRSPFALVSSLGGQGSLKVRNGVVKGFDLKAVSDQLKKLDSGLDLLRLFNASMQGGQMVFSALDGTFRVEKGVLRSDDLKLVADAGEGTTTGHADLPRWTMDFTSRFRLTEHPKAPPFGMQARGPIDNPSRIFRFEELQTFLLQRGVGTLLRKALGGKKAQDVQGQQQQKQQQPKRSQGEELLRGIFDVLRKK